MIMTSEIIFRDLRTVKLREISPKIDEIKNCDNCTKKTSKIIQFFKFRRK